LNRRSRLRKIWTFTTTMRHTKSNTLKLPPKLTLKKSQLSARLTRLKLRRSAKSERSQEKCAKKRLKNLRKKKL
jgi:hypothetical protein